MAKYQLVQLDAWGNKQDGWELNNRFPLDIYFDFDLDEWHEIGFRKLIKKILNAVYQVGCLATTDMRKLNVDLGYGEYLEIYQKKDGCPLFALELIQEDE